MARGEIDFHLIFQPRFILLNIEKFIKVLRSRTSEKALISLN